MDITAMEGLIPGEKNILIYRIIQELLNNITKHANASRVDINAIQENDRIRIFVSDNGTGFDPDSVLQAELNDDAAGLGLRIVEQRVDLLGGEVEICSSKDRGTTTTITIPMQMEN